MQILLKSKDLAVISQTDINVVLEMSNGNTTKSAASKLSLSQRKVEGILDRLRLQCDCRSTTHLVATFLRQGIIK